MKVTHLGTVDSGKSGSPAAFATDRGTFLIQGYKVTDEEALAEVHRHGLPDHEDVVEPHARVVVGERREVLLGERVAVDRDVGPVRAEVVGDEARVAARAERAVDGGLAVTGPQQVEQLGGEDGDVRGGHLSQHGSVGSGSP